MGRETFGPSRGGNSPSPLRTHEKLDGQTRAFPDLVYRSNPRLWTDWMEDFGGKVPSYDLYVPLVSAAGISDIPTTSTAKGDVRIPHGGVLLAADVVCQTSLAIDGTNYVVFSATNLLGAGSGSAAMLATASPANSTFTGGAAITADVPYALTVSATAANLRVAAGDLVQCIATVTGTLGGIKIGPVMRLRIGMAPAPLSLRTIGTAGSPLGQVDANVANGTYTCTLQATSEAAYAGLDYADQLTLPTSKGVLFAAFVKINTADITTAQTFVAGVCSAFNSTLGSTTLNAWFRLSASMALKAEVDDNTNDLDLQDCAFTVVKNTWYLLRIDLTDTGNIRFWVDENVVATLSAPAFVTVSPNLVQPIVGIQKSTGSTTPSFTVDFIRALARRI